MVEFSLHRKIGFIAIVFSSLVFWANGALAQNTSPHLVLTGKEISAIRKDWAAYPVFKKSFLEAKNKVDAVIGNTIDVPVPKDAAGYTHERHKQNYTEMYLAGFLYQVTGEKKYAEFVKKMLLKYADLYPTLKQHPEAASSSPGRLFWQSLNEYNWLIYTSQAYDCVKGTFSIAEQKLIEKNVFRNMAEYFAIERVEEMDLIHNHGTYSCTAVGLAGFILHDTDLVNKALFGSKKDTTAGYIAQLKTLISPSGYYTEGAYYARYELLPLFVLAKAIDNNLPEMKIFKFRDSLFNKVLQATLQQTTINGKFLPLNDGVKDKNYLSPEIMVALDIVYDVYGGEKALLDIAKKQDKVMLSGAGLKVAKALAEIKNIPEFERKSVNYTDGANGDEGGLSILRTGKGIDESMIVYKYTAHGLSHGHYDKLSFSYYDNGDEVIRDYGSARFVNVDQKWGGRYLPENKSFAMQTVAHNTLVVDEKTQFGGKIEVSEKYHPDAYFFSIDNPNCKVTSAKFVDPTNPVKTQRTLALVKITELASPIVIDVIRAESDKIHSYDIPFYYAGDFISSTVKYTANDKSLKPLGKGSGYQHLWNLGEGTVDSSLQVTWLKGNRFYSLTASADSTTSLVFTRIGASDPKYNLRNDPAFIIRNKEKSCVVASVVEPHGLYDSVNEFTQDSYPQIQSVKVLKDGVDFTAVEIQGKNSIDYILIISNNDSSSKSMHNFMLNGISYKWTGQVYFEKHKGD
jgi:hypothetical protein